MINTIDAIKALRPKAQFVIRGDVIEWMDDVQTQPTDAEITAEVTRLQAVYDSQAYARSRKAKYGLLNQFEMQFDDAANGTTTWIDAINAIKQEFPK
tara:strand:- start:146 stop:436 length:291 start_codon:yes stop_codon:yes gene_type:complete